MKKSLPGYLFASPWLLGLLIFAAYPIVISLYYSMCDYSVLKEPVFIGFRNYTKLFSDENFRTALVNTLLFAVVSVPVGTVVNLALAMLLNAKIRGQAWFRTIFFIPSLVPAVPLSVLGLQMFNSDHGMVNALLGPVLGGINNLTGGIHRIIPILPELALKAPTWLNDKDWSKPVLVLLAVWTGGGAVVIYLAGLQEVPTHLYEAADLDGATGWQKTKNVTIPLLSPVILFNVIMAIIGSMQYFTQAYVIYGGAGAPARSTYFYAMMMYENAFTFQKMGYASAMGWILFIMIVILTYVSLKFSESRVHYEGG
ncbi:MAG: sugar ABC transporter permease [Armatimonadota bacterium]